MVSPCGALSSGVRCADVVARHALLSVFCGIALTSITALAATVAADAQFEDISQVLFWPNSLLQIVAPCHNIGSPARPMCEGSPLNVLAYFVSLPLAVIVYSALSYWWLRARSALAPNNSLERSRDR